MKQRHRNRDEIKDKKFAKGKNKHHLTPESRGGKRTPSNLLDIHIEKHFYWHKIFGNLTLEEVIGLLIRLKNLKGR